MRWILVAIVTLVSAATALAASSGPALNVQVAPVTVTHRTFDPAHQPPEMPHLTPPETAVCVGNFLANASVSARATSTDATHAAATITHIDVTLNLDITIWTPKNATKTVIDHEEGHRKISEYFYKDAAEIAREIALPYLDKKYPLNGSDINGKLTELTNRVARDVVGAYSDRMIVKPTQVRYDEITDHSRKNIPVDEAIAQAIRETSSAPTGSATRPAD